MNPTPKTLQVFLPEGTPAGIQTAELTTRIMQAISVPRTHLKQFFARPGQCSSISWPANQQFQRGNHKTSTA